ncbi:MAG: PaaI family thioesterase [Chloroflexota bacterium]|nr:PaaI family thioesterase [Chloroflexota bacterium]MCY3637850.1 PaaI family thioesterase [Chloroflexota bacterium]MDE2687474.1 PaaI family thioesterase [Chloroflexota bacterium]MYC08118.1 PaaI family thioesterase [Chloroflexota bacterium]
MSASTIEQNPHVGERDTEDDEQQVREVSQGYSNCFGCGEDNPIGLRLKYRFEGDALVTDFRPGIEHEGWPGIVNGGIIATLLYEIMENYAYHSGSTTMMRDMEVKFIRPARIRRRITAIARLDIQVHREMTVTATLMQGKTVAEGTAHLTELSEAQIERIGIKQPDK